jgi:regulator of sigma E protease
VIDSLVDSLRTVLAFAVVLGVLVFIHELGHYLAARWRGVYVEAFSVGFGRAITQWTDRRGTVWKLAWLPLGGYVKLHGQERPEDVPQEVRDSWRPGETFHEKTVGSRAIIVAAGPIANFLLAMVLFALLFLASGRPITAPVVGEVLAGSAAARAGMLVEDRVQTINGTPIRTFEDIQRIVSAHPKVRLTITVEREKVIRTLAVTPDERELGGRVVGLLGIRGGQLEYQPMGVVESIVGGISQTWTVTVDTLSGVSQMIIGRRGTEELGGPLRIAQISGQVASIGIGSLISFIAVLSVNLGLINLFPVPVLDGGHLLFYLAEAIRGRPLSAKAQEYGFRAGIAVLAGLFVFATWNDLSHIGLFRWVAGLLG